MTISVVLHAPAVSPGNLGAGLTVTLSGGVRPLATATFWERKYRPLRPGTPAQASPPSADDLRVRYYALAGPAAVWIMYQLRRRGSAPPLGTDNWESYALFKAGTECFENKNAYQARKLLSQALDLDAGNIGARVNLARVDWREQADRTAVMTKCAMAQLAQLAERNHSKLQFRRHHFDTTDSFRWDPLWYRPAYIRAAFLGHGYFQALSRNQETLKTTGHLEPEAKRQCAALLSEATEEAHRLVWAIETTITEIDKGPGGPRRILASFRRAARRQRIKEDRALRDLLRRLETQSVLVYATLIADENDHSTNPAPRRPHQDSRLALLPQLENRDCLTSRKLMDFLGPICLYDPSPTYNLACYFSVLGGLAAGRPSDHPNPVTPESLLDEALEHLRYTPTLREGEYDWVSTDPALSALQSHPHSRRRFEALLAEWCPQGTSPRPPTLNARLGIIGPHYAQKLAQAGISDMVALVKAATHAQDVEALADDLGVRVDLLRRWMRMADLVDRIETTWRREEVSTGYAVLLDAADVGSVDLFKAADHHDLVIRLRSLNKDMKAVDHQPTVRLVKDWQAKLARCEARVP